ncbi:MAG: hypothetical protein M3065_15645, partial [Actinomycetota bacterium]|nr:hypothetical protein [Actinomycetota bacterium]
MTLLASYHTVGGEPRRIELAPASPSGRRLLLDRGRSGPARVVAELEAGEGVAQAGAVLHAGGYLRRAKDGEPRLCRT